MRKDPGFGAQSLHVLALGGDKASLEIFRRAGRALGIAVSNMINVLNISVYCFGGGVAGAWDVLQPHVLEQVRQRSFVYNATAATRNVERETVITCALLGADAGLYGAARLAILHAGDGRTDSAGDINRDSTRSPRTHLSAAQ
jgi:glucokinase